MVGSGVELGIGKWKKNVKEFYSTRHHITCKQIIFSFFITWLRYTNTTAIAGDQFTIHNYLISVNFFSRVPWIATEEKYIIDRPAAF